MGACRNKPFSWQTRSVKKSPFRSLNNAKAAEKAFLAGKQVGFTARSSLKSMGRIPRSTGCYQLGSKYATRRKQRR
jgi:hypothetical protein